MYVRSPNYEHNFHVELIVKDLNGPKHKKPLDCSSTAYIYLFICLNNSITVRLFIYTLTYHLHIICTALALGALALPEQ